MNRPSRRSVGRREPDNALSPGVLELEDEITDADFIPRLGARLPKGVVYADASQSGRCVVGGLRFGQVIEPDRPLRHPAFDNPYPSPAMDFESGPDWSVQHEPFPLRRPADGQVNGVGYCMQ
jgi:hypothetical protein